MTNKKTVLVGGCFDLLHYGHISFLKQAKSHGDYLIVALESDENVRKMKGKTRPIHTQAQRKEMLLALSVINEVIELPPMHSDEEYYNFTKKLNPDIVALTEGDPILTQKMDQAKLTGAKVVIIEKIHTPSTSQLAKLLELE